MRFYEFDECRRGTRHGGFERDEFVLSGDGDCDVGFGV